MTERKTGPGGVAAFVAHHRAAVGTGFAVLAAAMTVLWLLVVPETGQDGGVRGAIIRFGHPLCWFLLTLVGILHARGKAPRLKVGLGYAALAAYLAFLAALALDPAG